MKHSRTNSAARRRILETADRLFYQEGFRAVGIDRIIAESRVAKMSLYHHFPSKDDLILAVLQHREQEFLAFFEEQMELHRKKMKHPLKVFFAALKDVCETPEFRGCAFINASVELVHPEHPGFAFARGHKQRFREFLAGLIEQAAGKSGRSLAAAIDLLVEGALVTALMQGRPDVVDVARDAAMKLLKSLENV